MQIWKVKDYPEITVQFEDLDGSIDFEALFGRSAPVHIEVGCGKGAFLLSEAKANPEINYFGIEWANKFYRYTVDRMGRWGISNVRMIRADAAELVADFFPDASIERYHIYFPDPWPKRYHNRRRFFSDQNMAHLLRTLTSNGIINLATDHEDYYNWMIKTLNRAVTCGAMEQIDFIRPAGAMDGERVGTNYERKYIKEGRKTYVAAARLLDRTKWVTPIEEE
jgi:tRNA (guanine-N7-)-methyltransferase